MGKRRQHGDGLPTWLAAGRPGLHRLLRNRRGAMAAFGAGAAALTGLSSTMAVLLADGASGEPKEATGAQRVPQKAGSFSNRDASYTSGVGDANDLGAGGLAATPTAAAQAALAATPRYPTPLARDPVLHLLRRATFGPTPQDVADVKRVGIDAWIDRQLDPGTVEDPGGDAVSRLYPYLSLTVEQLRRSVPDDKRNDPSWHLGRATIGRQIWSGRQLQVRGDERAGDIPRAPAATDRGLRRFMTVPFVACRSPRRPAVLI